MAMHPDQLHVPVEVVRRLVRAQFPVWAELPVRELRTAGTVHAIFRLGDGLAARFPLQGTDVAAIRGRLQVEADAAAELHGRTSVPTPEPVAIGEPGEGYPLPWSVQTWLPGATAVEEDVSRSTRFAQDLAELVRAIRSLDTRGRSFRGPGRGGDLRAHDDWVQTCLAASGHLVDVARLGAQWDALRELPRTQPDAMTHGDLIPHNLLVADGRLAGVLDVGGLAAADPALDLVGAWHLLEAGPRQVFRAELDCDELSWARGQAWALEQALGLGWYYEDSNPSMHALGLTTLRRILDEPVRPIAPG